jgi:DNA end-binding protein Ku
LLVKRRMAARSISTASLSFGLVSIPVKLYSTKRRESQVSFHWLHAKCGNRVQMKWYCPKDDELVERKELVRGFEVEKGKHVAVEDEELKETAEEKRDDIGILEFVPIGAINPLYHEHDYYLAPDRGADKAYGILARALAKAGRVAIGRYAARGDDHVVAIQEQDGGLVMLQLRFADEVRSIDDIPIPSSRVSEQELTLAGKLIEQYAVDELDMTRFKDAVKLRKLKLIEDKVDAGEVREAAAAAREEATGQKPAVIDLMAALKASLGATKPAKAAKNGKAHAARAVNRRRRTRASTKSTGRGPSRKSA